MHWCVAQGETNTKIKALLGISESTIQRLMLHPLGVIYFDVLQLQKGCKFGGASRAEGAPELAAQGWATAAATSLQPL